MGQIETEAIILRTYNLSEADKIVVCLTRSHGVVRAVARGARKLKSRFGAGLEPFTVVHASYYEKENRELVSLRHAEIQKSYFHLAANEQVVQGLAYMSELTVEFAPPHEPNEKLFRMVRACLEALEQSPEQLPALVRYFEVWMLKLSGFLPDLRRCAECNKNLIEPERAFLNAELKPRCKVCSKGLGALLLKETQTQIQSIQRLSPKDFALNLNSQKEVWDEIGQITQKLIGRALEREPRAQMAFR